MDYLQVGTSYVDQDIFTLHEAAQKFRIGYSSLCKLVAKYKEQIGVHLFQAKKNTPRKNWCLDKQGMTILLGVKNLNPTSLTRTDCDITEVEAKKQITELAIAAPSSELAELLKDPIIAFRIDQLKMQKDIEAIQQELIHVKQLATQAPPEHITNPQREFLNERVRNYAIQTGIPFSFIWSNLHRSVQKSSLEAYKFGDYKTAIARLKEMYAQSGIDWS